MQTTIVQAGLRGFDGDLDRFVIFTLIARQSAATPIDGMDSAADPPDSRAISINSLAASLSRPFETVRRHVNALIAQEVVARTPSGVVALASGLQRPEMVEMSMTAHDAFVRLVEDLQAFDLPMPSQRVTSLYHPAVGVRAAADIMLAVADNNRGLHQEWINLVLYSTILCANARAYTYDPELARRYADQFRVPPDSLRRPLRVSALARTLRLPYATVQRRVERLVADGRVKKARGGLLVSEEWLNLPSSVAVSVGSYQNIRRILAAATAAGFPIASPAQAYVRGRPTPSVIQDRPD
ncbi:hypothetical protein [Sphingomonas sp. BE270]|jgi:DNA-binding Lrp family transcriptional regulator|nr:hypothetical protein [Sphingomonas sp. BE270]